MSRRSLLLILLCLVAAGAFAARVHAGETRDAGLMTGQRLVDLLPKAVQLPPPPPQKSWIHLRSISPSGYGPLGIYVPLESERPFVVRMRLGDQGDEHGAAEIRGLTEEEARGFRAGPVPLPPLLPGTLLGACLPLDAGDNRRAHGCQRSDQLDAKQVGILIVVTHAELGVEELDVFDTALEDWRAPPSPLLGPLVRRWYAKTELGWRGVTGLAAPPAGEYDFDVTLPPHPTFRFGVGHEPGALEAPIRFTVEENGHALYDEVTPPDHRFHDAELPLTGAPGQKIRLTLRARGLPDRPGEARGLWLDPRVLGASTAPNILLVTIDALRPDHLSAYGYPRDTSPNLEKLLRLGTRFDRSTAQAGSTWESCTSLLSGLYAAHTGVHTRGQVPRPDITFLPDLLSARGYETFAGATGADFPPWMLTAFDNTELLSRAGNGAAIPQREPALLARQVAQEVHRAGGHPLFLWLHLDHPHYPLTPTQPLRYNPGYAGRFAEGFTLADHEKTTLESVTTAEGKQIVALYDAAVRDADDSLGAILAALSDADQLQNTIVVVTADHGEMIGSRGLVLEHTAPFNDVLHVPLVIAWPASLSPRSPVDTRVQSIDLTPTLLSLAGLPPATGIDGWDLSPLLRSGTIDERPAYSEAGGILSRYERDAHFIYNPNHVGLAYYYHPALIPVADEELFDLGRDPEEHHDLASAQPDRARAQREALLGDIGTWLDPDAADSSRELGQDALDALRNAGYLHETAAVKTVAAQPSVSTPK